MQIKYLGPSGDVNVAPYGPHRKGDVKEYPDDFARELLATSIKQQFEPVGDWEEEVIVAEKITGIDAMTVAQIKAELDILGIEYPDKAKKAELFELYEAARNTSQQGEASGDAEDEAE